MCVCIGKVNYNIKADKSLPRKMSLSVIVLHFLSIFSDSLLSPQHPYRRLDPQRRVLLRFLALNLLQQ